MGDAEDGKGGFFEGVEGFFEESAEPRPAPLNIVIAAKDTAVMHNSYRQTLVKAAERGGRIRPNMRGQPVAEGVWQVVDQGDVAELVTAAPEDAMLFDRIPTIRAEDDNTAARFHHPDHFPQRLPVIIDMLNHFITEQKVKAVLRKRHRFPNRLDNACG